MVIITTLGWNIDSIATLSDGINSLNPSSRIFSFQATGTPYSQLRCIDIKSSKSNYYAILSS